MNGNIETVVIPEKFTDKIRRMEVGQSIQINEKERVSVYNRANQASPGAKFSTRKITDGEVSKVYLTRTA